MSGAIPGKYPFADVSTFPALFDQLCEKPAPEWMMTWSNNQSNASKSHEEELGSPSIHQGCLLWP
eukprot:2592259-Amphidinium_carterae.1